MRPPWTGRRWSTSPRTRSSTWRARARATCWGTSSPSTPTAFTPIDATLIPTGEIRPVRGTPFDFTTPETIGARIAQDDEQLRLGTGYDHNYVLNKRGGAFGFAARVHEPTSGRVMEVWSTEPGLQLYSGNHLEGKVPRDVGKGGALYTSRTGFCLEPQHFPDSPNKPHFPSTVLKAGDWYSGKTVYKFSVQT